VRKKRRIFVFGYYGWQNTGDDAMLYALLQELPEFYPEAEFLVLSHIPVVTPDSVRGKVRFIKPTAIPAFWEIAKSDVFIIGGGSHIHDYGKSTKSIKRLLRILIIVAFAKITGNKVYLIGNGIGPITTEWGKILTRFICRMVDYITVRDRASYQVLKTLGLVRATEVSLDFDLSALLATPLEGNVVVKEGTSKKILGICVTAVFEQYYSDEEKDLVVVDEIAKALNQLLIAIPQLWVYLFIFKDGPRDSDVYITELLKRQLKPAERVKLISYNPDPRQTLSQVAQCSAFVGTKYHSCLFAYLNSIPLLVVDYHPKCRAFADEVGLPKHAVISLGEVLGGTLRNSLEDLIESPQRFLATLPVSVARNRAEEGIRRVKWS